MLQIFKVSDHSGLRIGYNSIGADCISNNLHFHLVYADQMFKPLLAEEGKGDQEGGPSETFPIELSNKKLFFRTSL